MTLLFGKCDNSAVWTCLTALSKCSYLLAFFCNAAAGICYNSVSSENLGRLGHWHKRKLVVHPGNKLRSLESASRWWSQTRAGEWMYEGYDTAGLFRSALLYTFLCSKQLGCSHSQHASSCRSFSSLIKYCRSSGSLVCLVSILYTESVSLSFACLSSLLHPFSEDDQAVLFFLISIQSSRTVAIVFMYLLTIAVAAFSSFLDELPGRILILPLTYYIVSGGALNSTHSLQRLL